MINMTFSTANIKESFYTIVLWHIHQYLHPDVGLRRTCAYYCTFARAMCVQKCVRKGFCNCVCDVRACSSFWGVQCAIALLLTFWYKTTK